MKSTLYRILSLKEGEFRLLLFAFGFILCSLALMRFCVQCVMLWD
ncbi:hypothetical protein [Helicobacter sp. MIT 11-5569]|nr:hypothetical protein [Helicobacter sp. MIT 11-5569]